MSLSGFSFHISSPSLTISVSLWVCLYMPRGHQRARESERERARECERERESEQQTDRQKDRPMSLALSLTASRPGLILIMFTADPWYLVSKQILAHFLCWTGSTVPICSISMSLLPLKHSWLMEVSPNCPQIPCRTDTMVCAQVSHYDYSVRANTR